MSERPRWVAVGRIMRPHGVKGEVSVLPLSEVQARFEPGSTLFLDERGERTIQVASSRPHHQRLLVTFEGVGDRAGAEGLHGIYLFVPADASPPLAQGEYWPHQLIGCAVATEEGVQLGEITEVVRAAANDVWVARPAGESAPEVLIPALKTVVASVDVQTRSIVVRDVPGLTTP